MKGVFLVENNVVEKYRSLCKEANDLYERYYNDGDSTFIKGKEQKDDVKMRGYEKCKELNLWTYWQGRNAYQIDIMVIGQDWGAPHNELKNNYIAEELKMIEDGVLSNVHDNDFPPIDYRGTDGNLYMLFRSLNIGFDDIYNVVYSNLFFTNGCLGYRTGNNVSGGFKKELITNSGKWETKNGGKCIFDELGKSIEAYIYPQILNILQPKIILCLGCDTYLGMLQILGLLGKEEFKDEYYNTIIERRREKPLELTLDKCDAYIFPIAHCGALGTSTRAQNFPKPKYEKNCKKEHYKNKSGLDGFQLQLQDWQYIKKFIITKCGIEKTDDIKSAPADIKKLFCELDEERRKRLVVWAKKWDSENYSKIKCESSEDKKKIDALHKAVNEIVDLNNFNERQIKKLQSTINIAFKAGLIMKW